MEGWHKRNRDQRVAVLVDGQNIYHTAKELYSSKVKYPELLTELVDGRKLVRAIAYVLDTGKSKGFFSLMRNAGFQLRIKKSKDHTNAKDWDMGIAVDAFALYENGRVDCIILVTNDGDFSRLVQFLKMHGVKVELAGFKSKMSQDLQEQVDQVFSIGDYPNLLMNPTFGEN